MKISVFLLVVILEFGNSMPNGNRTCIKDSEECTSNDTCCGWEHRCIQRSPNDTTRCIVDDKTFNCKADNDTCFPRGDPCCPGYECTLVSPCKKEESICTKTPDSWCKLEIVRYQCPRKCGACDVYKVKTPVYQCVRQSKKPPVTKS